MTTSSIYVLLLVITTNTLIVSSKNDVPNGIPDPITDQMPTPKPSVIETKPPSNRPTVSPFTPTSYPTTYEPTTNGQTRSPSVLPSNAPSVSPTSTTYTRTDDDISDIQDINRHDRNHNGKDDLLEFYSMPAIPIQIACSIITLILFILMIRHMHLNKRDPKMRIVCTIKVPVTLTFLCNNIAIICIMIVSIMIATANAWDQHTYNIALIPYYTASVSYALGKLFLEMFFIVRVFHAFKQSAFNLSYWTMMVFFMWALMISVAWFLMFYVITIDQEIGRA
eukprot:235576_1